MLKIVQFFAKRPTDPTIRSVRAGYALALSAFLAYASPAYVLPFASALGEPNASYAEYALAALVLVPGAVAAAGLCVAKKKTVRLLQLSGAVFLFVLSATVTVETPAAADAPAQSSTGALSASELLAPKKAPEFPVNVTGWLNLFAFLALLSGITGKMVTEKCQKHGEVIKKIRV